MVKQSGLQPLRWLHRAASLMLQGQVQARSAGQSSGVQVRRTRQRQRVGRLLMDTSIPGWPLPERKGDWLWRALRWGGPALVLASWLSQR
ncbi:MAG: hypothetical protein AB8B70_06995 [Prochlorococcus sp.]